MLKSTFIRRDLYIVRLLFLNDIVSSVGSANMDFRSFEQNFEVTAFVYDEDFCQRS